MPKKKSKENLRGGRFNENEDNFIRSNHALMTDSELAKALNRTEKSVTNRRYRLGINTSKSKPKLTTKHREAYLANLNDDDRKKEIEKEIKLSSTYRSICESLSPDEQMYYVEKYVDFMMDPTVETMTAMEKDALHQLILAEIRIIRYMAEERKWHRILDEWDPLLGKKPYPISRSKEIAECQSLILKCQHSLNVERIQRLKDSNDQSFTFANLIKEMKNPQTRYRMGLEAQMLKVITEKTYNDLLGTNIFSGRKDGFNLALNFRDKESVDNLKGNFLPSIKDEEEKENKEE